MRRSFQAPRQLKHPMELDDTSYSLDIANEIIFDCVQEVMAINLIEEYLGELTNDERDARKVPRIEYSNE